MTTRRVFGILAISALVAVGGLTPSQPAVAAPAAELWDIWTKHDEASQQIIDHGDFQRFLNSYLVSRPGDTNLVDYARVSERDKGKLDAYINKLSDTPISTFNRDQQMAFWINLYNAVTVKVVLDHYPVETIKDIDISPGLFASGPWGKKLIRVEGEKLSLDDIEHRILRPIWKDARIHYAVNCAAKSCPELRKKVFKAGRLDRQLDAAAKAYVNNPRGALVESNQLVLSSIFDWYGDDFGDGEQAVITHISSYANPALREQLAGITKVDNYRYDWDLNAVPAAAVTSTKDSSLNTGRSYSSRPGSSSR